VRTWRPRRKLAATIEIAYEPEALEDESTQAIGGNRPPTDDGSALAGAARSSGTAPSARATHLSHPTLHGL
jgi:hypothetical protein